jgi:hypothetical protein
MNEQFHPNLLVFDRTRAADGFLFATGGDRCRYLGKSRREKPDWLKQNEGRYQRIEDVRREDAPRMPPVEAEINLGAGPAEPAGSSSSPEVRNDGDDKDDVALADAPLGDCSRPCEPTSLPTPVKENAEKHGYQGPDAYLKDEDGRHQVARPYVEISRPSRSSSSAPPKPNCGW